VLVGGVLARDTACTCILSTTGTPGPHRETSSKSRAHVAARGSEATENGKNPTAAAAFPVAMAAERSSAVLLHKEGSTSEVIRSSSWWTEEK
jgi:hypothetical protein